MIHRMRPSRGFPILCALLSLMAPRSQNKETNGDWPVWGGDPESTHYSKLAQINRSNVKKLAMAWTFDTSEQGGSQTSPIIVGNVLYAISPTQKIFALDAATGKLLWKFDSRIKGTQPDRGLAYWSSGKDKRILAGAWKTSGAANNWAGMALDRKRGIVFAPTGSAAFDFYGADRIGDDLFANSLIALNAETGERIWHFQGVKHDIWDKDFPSAPALVTLRRDGKDVKAVAQTTKQGFLYLFERTSGKPLFPIEYHSYPASTIPGEVAASEQPLPTKPAPYARQLLTEEAVTDRTPEAHQWTLEKFRSSRSEGQFVPFSVGKDTVIFPGFDGGAEWGGPAIDPETATIYINSNEMAWMAALAENADSSSPKATYMSQCSVCHGDKMTGSPPAIPSLIGIAERLAPDQITATIKS